MLIRITMFKNKRRNTTNSHYEVAYETFYDIVIDWLAITLSVSAFTRGDILLIEATADKV